MMRRMCAVLILTAALVGCGGGSAEFAIPDDAQKTASGISWKLIKTGTGTDRPHAKSLVLVDYTGWTMDGEKFDSSVDRGEPVEYPLNGFIPGWVEGMQLMVKGEKRRFWIPAKLAYEGFPEKPQGMLVFDVELLDFK